MWSSVYIIITMMHRQKKENSYLTVKSYRYATPASSEHMVFVEFLYSVGFFPFYARKKRLLKKEKMIRRELDVI